MNNKEIIAEGQEYVMNTYGRLPIALVEGKGSYVWDADGKRYLDFVAGIAVNALGHCHPAVVEAISEQAHKLIHCSNLYWIEPQVKLAKMLVEHSCFDKAFFCNSGAEANEAAFKLARKYAKAQGYTNRYEVISTANSFHGRTLATLNATGQEKVHHNFEPLLDGFKSVPYNDLAAIEDAISDKTCAIIVEPIQGEGGVIVAHAGYLAGLRHLCDEHDLLLIFDEVQVGCGRTGKLFAYQNSGVKPDVMTLAKALAGGVAIGAMLVNQRADVFVPGEHASTFGGNPLATAAAVAAINQMLVEDIPEGVTLKSEYFICKLQQLVDKYDSLLSVRGQGLLLGLVANKPAGAVVEACQGKGLLINCTAGSVLRFVPPLTVSNDEIDEAVAILDQALQECGF